MTTHILIHMADDSKEFTHEIDPAELAALEDERIAMGETEAQMANRLFRNELVAATYSICHLAKFGINEKLRYDAAKYVVERNLGRLQDANALDDVDPFEDLLAKCVIDTNLSFSDSSTEDSGE